MKGIGMLFPVGSGNWPAGETSWLLVFIFVYDFMCAFYTLLLSGFLELLLL